MTKLNIVRETARLTKTAVEAAWSRRASGQRLIITDSDVAGLSLVVHASSMAWVLNYRPRGVDPSTGRRWPNRALRLGSPDTLPVDKARREANRAKDQSAEGADPVAARKTKLADAQQALEATLGRLIEMYGHHLPTQAKRRGHGLPSAKYVREEIAQIRAAAADMKVDGSPIASVTDAHLRKMLNATAAHPATARLRFGAVSRFFDWAKDEKHIRHNPVDDVGRAKRPKAPAARDHFLEPADMARLWRAADALREPVWRDLARFLLAVPCRRGEATSLDWGHIDMPGTVWSQPGLLTKNGDPHRLHLHSLALAVLESRRGVWADAEANGDPVRRRELATKWPRLGPVFPAPKSGREINTFSDIRAEMNAAVASCGGEPLAAWSWHDFRRSFASCLGEAGIPESVADAILNHRQAATRGGVLGVYQRSSRWPEQTRAMALWGRILSAAIDGREDSVVVQLAAAGASP